MPYIPHTQAELELMLAKIGVASTDDLFAAITPDLRPKSFDLPAGKSEEEVRSLFEGLAAQNNTSLLSFLGAGYYDHSIPAAVDALSGQSAFATAYTPYQAECSQGTLQAIFEFQTAVARLFELDCANASIYDGGTSLFEAAAMSTRATRRKKVVLDASVNPLWRAMLQTYSANLDMEIVVVEHDNGVSALSALEAAIDKTTACVIVQNPNFFGAIEDFTQLFAHAKAQGALSVISAYPVMQSVLKTPGAMGADIAVAEGQSLGLPLSFGGPYLGLLACNKSLIRQIPGRLVGRTHDTEGRIGYVLTLQAREQHIRRAKATSNICSNQSLCALRCLIHLSLLGPNGLASVAERGMEMCREAVRELTQISGVRLLNNHPFGNEVALRLPKPALEVIGQCVQQYGLVPGYAVGLKYPGLEDVLLVACTEKTTSQQIAQLSAALKAVLAS